MKPCPGFSQFLLNCLPPLTSPTHYCICPFTLSHSHSFSPPRSLSASHSLSLSLAGSRLQNRLELSGQADVILFLTDDALDGWRQATGVPGEDDGVAVIAATIFLHGAAGVGDGVVVIVGVDHPVVVTCFKKGKERLAEEE